MSKSLWSVRGVSAAVAGWAWSCGALNAQPCGWVERYEAPPSQSGHVCLSDPAGGLLMCPSGLGGAHQTWRFIDGGWALIADDGPSIRHRAAACTDTVRGRGILFGGQVAPGLVFSNETWTWQNSEWTALQPAQSPPARANHAMAYDEAHDRVVVFGGYTGAGADGSTWLFDGTSWTLASHTGPSPREAHCMAYDAHRGRVVLFGGLSNGVTCHDETWEWDGTSWSMRSQTGPAGRAGAAMAYDPARRVTVLFGGGSCNLQYFGDTWEWDGARWTPRPVEGPGTRYSHAMSYDTATSRILLFGGNAPGVGERDDTWAWDGVRWTEVGGPGDRAGHAMTYDRDRERVVVFGGGGSSTVWEWNGDAWSGVTPQSGARPDPRGSYTMAYDTTRARTVCVGGRLGIEIGAWSWDGTAWTALEGVESPTAGAIALSTTYDSARDRVVLVSAVPSGPGFAMETWEHDGSDWELRDVGGVPLGTSWGLSTSYDPVRQLTQLRTTGPADQPRDWAWEGTEWIALSKSGDPQLGIGDLVFDEARGRMLMLVPNEKETRTLAWSGDGWIDTGLQGLPSRHAFGSSYDAARRRVVFFGGESPCSKPLCAIESDLYELPVVPPECAADWDCSGTLDSSDFFAFLASFFGGGDFNADGVRDSRDFFEYLAAFFAGCG